MSIRRGGKNMSVKLTKHQSPNKKSVQQTKGEKHVDKNKNLKFKNIQHVLPASENEFLGLNMDDIDAPVVCRGSSVAVAKVES